MVKRLFWREFMKVRTTLHLGSETVQKLDTEALSRGMSRAQMVVFLTHRLMQRYRKLSSFMGAVRYQKRSDDAEWKRMHVALDQMNHSFLLEMRCFYRFSVSALIAMELDAVLNGQNLTSISNKSNGVIDNYNYNGRLMMVNKLKTSIRWKFFWNIPTNPKNIYAE